MASFSACAAGGMMRSTYSFPAAVKRINLILRSVLDYSKERYPSFQNFLMAALTVCFVAERRSQIPACVQPS